jgi:outer membrane protein assembly factor BamB
LSRAASFVVASAAVVSLCALAGCERFRASATPEAPLWLHHPGSAIEVLGRRELTAEGRKTGELYERGQPAIDALHRRVFVGSSDHGLYALRAEDLSTTWRFETLGAVQGEPLYDADDDAVLFGSNDGALYKVRAADGKLLWRFATNAEVARRPVIRDGVVYVVNANDTLIAINEQTGKLKWHQHRAPAFGMEVAGYAGPALGTDKIYTAFSDGVVMAYSLEDGSEQWPSVDLAAEAEQASGEVPRFLDSDATPVFSHLASGAVVFVAGYAGGVYALDAETGSRVWANEKAAGVTELLEWQQPSHALRGDGPDVPERRVLIASSGVTGLWGIDPTDGHTLWHRNLPEGGITAPAAIENAILVGTSRYGLFLFSPLSGGLIDGIETGNGFAMAPATNGRRAFVMTNGGSILGLYVSPPTFGLPKPG